MFTRRHEYDDTPTLKINDQNIEYKNELQYLGVTLDNKLFYGSHIVQVKGKAKGRIKTMYSLP